MDFPIKYEMTITAVWTHLSPSNPEVNYLSKNLLNMQPYRYVTTLLLRSLAAQSSNIKDEEAQFAGADLQYYLHNSSSLGFHVLKLYESLQFYMSTRTRRLSSVCTLEQ